MGSIRGILLDLDGVLYVGNRPVEGAVAAIEYLQSAGIPFRCISNTTRRCRVAIAARLSSMGFCIPAGHIFTPAVAASALLREQGLSRCMLLVHGDVIRDFTDAGIQPAGPDADAVVVGDAGMAFTYGTLNAAFRRLIDGAAFFALEKDRYWMDEDGLSLSAGPFVAGLEYASGRQAVIVGKPSKAFFNAAIASLGAAREATLMVGDDIRTDVGGALHAGLRGALVKTGKYREETVQASGIDPEFVIESIADLPSILS